MIWAFAVDTCGAGRAFDTGRTLGLGLDCSCVDVATGTVAVEGLWAGCDGATFSLAVTTASTGWLLNGAPVTSFEPAKIENSIEVV